MARQTTTQLQTTFQDGENVDGPDHKNWFDSNLNMEDNLTSVISGSIIMIDGNINATVGGALVSESIERVGKYANWSDGYLGNSEFISFSPADFKINQKSGTAGRTQINFIDQLAALRNGGGAINKLGNAQGYYAMKIIPKGFEAFDFEVFGDTNTNTITALSCRITTGITTLLATGTVNSSNPSVPSPFVFGSTAPGNGIQYIIVKWEAGANDILWGARVGIRRD